MSCTSRGGQGAEALTPSPRLPCWVLLKGRALGLGSQLGASRAQGPAGIPVKMAVLRPLSIGHVLPEGH